MINDDHGVGDILTASENAAPAASVDVVSTRLRDRLGATAVSLLLTDFAGHSMVRLYALGEPDGTSPQPANERISLDGSVYEQVIRAQRLHRERTDVGTRLLAPVTNRGDSIGILEAVLPGDASAGAVREIGETAHALGYIVIANQRFTDLYEWGQRSTPLTLAAEIQHQLLPNALTCEADQFTLAGSLEPAHQVAGDTFDYAFDRETLHLSLTDAMGSGVRSALAATLLVGALRGARRAGADLVEQARRADLALTEHEHDHATGLLMRVELRTGRVDVVNAGHVLPLRLRNGRVEELWLEPNMPFGIPFPHTYTVQHVDLQPGDRLMLLTDGVLERSGLDVATLIGRAHRLHPREAARYLTLEVIRAHQGNLPDDATVLCLDWYGVERPARTASGGASQDLASPAVRDEHRA